MFTNYDEIRRIARKCRKKYGLCAARDLCKKLGITLNPMHFGTEKTCIKGFIQRDCRCCTITFNADLPSQLQQFIIYHEIGHFLAGHLNEVVCTYPDFELGYNPANTIIAQQENEANFFVADYYLDDRDTCEALRTYPFATAAFALTVPIEFLDFKCRMLKKVGLLKGESSYYVPSNFLGKIEFTPELGNEVYEDFDEDEVWDAHYGEH